MDLVRIFFAPILQIKWQDVALPPASVLQPTPKDAAKGPPLQLRGGCFVTSGTVVSQKTVTKEALFSPYFYPHNRVSFSGNSSMLAIRNLSKRFEIGCVL